MDTSRLDKLRPCPNCNSPITGVKCESEPYAMKYVTCADCFMEGPHRTSATLAIEAWDKLPRRLDVPETCALTMNVGGIEYAVVWIHNGPMTFATITWFEKGKRWGVAGHSVCSPKDEYDQATGDKIAMRRACGIGNDWCRHDLRAVYQAYRLHVRGCAGAVTTESINNSVDLDVEQAR
jgi:hypothetical protein